MHVITVLSGAKDDTHKSQHRSVPVLLLQAFWFGKQGAGVVEGYEPNPTLNWAFLGAMERAQSVPLRGSAESNPFWSQKIQDECKLEAARPQALNVDGGFSGQPVQAASGETFQSQKALAEPSGKGRGGGAGDRDEVLHRSSSKKDGTLCPVSYSSALDHLRWSMDGMVEHEVDPLDLAEGFDTWEMLVPWDLESK